MKALKIIGIIAGVFLVLTIVLCGAVSLLMNIAPESTQAPVVVTATDVPIVVQPTYTPYPTYTPLPTATDVPPTQIPPTKVPTATNAPPVVSKPVSATEVECPNTVNYPPGVSSIRCFVFAYGQAAGVIYYNKAGQPMAAGASISIWDAEALSYDVGVFLGEAAVSSGWDINDTIGAISSITLPGRWYTYGTMQAKVEASNDSEWISFYIMPVSSTGFQG